MAIKVNLKPQIEREMNEMVELSGARSKTEYINQAVAEKNERLKRERQLAVLRDYFSRRGAELRAVNRELRAAAGRLDED
jgi:Arc/MetJ-type ribon-helix-helix transcriptional regulator